MTELIESAAYEGLLDLIDAPPPPKDDERIKAAKEYPVTVKVHINDRADCDKFADLLGCNLSSDQTEITFNKNAKHKAGATYTENRTDPLKRSTTHKTRDESILWGTTTDFRNDPIPPYQSFEIVLTDATQHIAFLRLLKQQLSFETTSPFVLNTRIYSCLLIRNDCKYRWRGRYNEDTDLSLRVLKDGDCTLQWNEFLQEKMATQALSGGNTAEFYHAEHLTGEDDPELGKYHANGTWNKSIMLEKMHPDVAKAVWKFGRWHHEVNYDKFKANKLRFKAGMETSDRTYPFELITR